MTLGDSSLPISTELVPAPEPAAERTLVIVLPGYGGDATDMKERGIAHAIHTAWPHADVLLGNATFAYYREGNIITRLHEDVVEPARRAGYRRIWIAGASMGGLGALLYEREYPGTLAGIVLFAPFLGDPWVQQEVRLAGGVRSWEPGPLPADVTHANVHRQIWKRVRAWAERPELAKRVWVACGTDDFLRSASQLLATALPDGHFVEEPGGHTWKTWARLTRSIFSRIKTADADAL